MRALAALLLLAPALAWANPAADAERAAERVLIEENVLTVYLTANDHGRLTLLFGRQVADWQIDAVLARLQKEPAIKGVTHTRIDTDYCPVR
ncbi:MAG: hypothetical protein R6W97_13470 [Thiobacillus sp.]